MMGITHLGQEVWYRYEETHYAPSVDEYGYPSGEGSTRVKLIEYPVLRHTPKGVWIALHYSMDEKFVLTDAKKRFACPTVDEARQSFLARKRRQISIHGARIRKAERAIEVLDSGRIDHEIWAWYPEDLDRYMRQKKGYVPKCGTCWDTGMILQLIPRGSSPPGNQRVGCPDCEPGQKIRADAEEFWRKQHEELNKNRWSSEKIAAFNDGVEQLLKEKGQAHGSKGELPNE